MANTISVNLAPLNTQPVFEKAATEASNIGSDTNDLPSAVPIALLILRTFQILSARIGANAEVVGQSLENKKKTISSCLELLNGLSTWNTPPITPKIPSDPLDPGYQDRINKTDALYLNGVSLPDSSYDAVKYTYGDVPKTSYSSLPIANGDVYALNKTLVVGELYFFPNSTNDSKYFVDLGRASGNNELYAQAKSFLELKTQSGTDFSSFKPGDLVQDTDTRKYYRIANDKTGVEVTGYPLQKFVQSPDDNVLATIKAQINQKITSASDLSKGDSLEIQRLQGFLTTVITMCVDLASTNNTAMNGIAVGKF